MRRLAIIALAASLIGTAEAGASTVGAGNRSIQFDGAPGENNDVAAALNVTGTEVLVSDRAGVSAGMNCVQLDPTQVRCDLGAGQVPVAQASLFFNLWDGRDRFAATTDVGAGTLLRVNGGIGADVIDARRSVAGALLYGDAGRDRLLGGPGGDALFGGPGRDLLAGGGAADRLAGEGSPDKLLAGPGNDLLRGGRSADRLNGGPGKDRAPDAERRELRKARSI